jgi:hypothetical protein
MAEGEKLLTIQYGTPSEPASANRPSAAVAPSSTFSAANGEVHAAQLLGQGSSPWDAATAVALLAALLDAFMVVWQHRTGTKSQLKLELFQSLTKHIQSAADAASTLTTYVRLIPIDLSTARSAHELGYPFAPTSRVPHLLDLHRSFMDAAVHAFVQIEHHAIMTPHAKLFQLALTSACHDVRGASEQTNRTLVFMLPVDNPYGGVLHAPDPPDEEAQANLSSVLNAYIESIETLDMYLADIQRELQRTLLTPLFNKRHAERRVPMDSRHRVIATDKTSARKLEHYFLNESAWGINKKRIEDEVRMNLADASK